MKTASRGPASPAVRWTRHRALLRRQRREQGLRRRAPMTHDDAFLQAIIESPDDDTPRLVYADWLDEHGQPERAEFIRVQCELASMPEDDGLRPPTRRVELEARERELLKKHGEQWVGPLRRWVNAWEFRRGFIEAVTAQLDLFLIHAEDLFRAAPLRHVSYRPPATGAHGWPGGGPLW